MKKILSIAAVIAILIGGYFLFFYENPQEIYVSNIDTEISALEAELEAVDQQIGAEGLDPDIAVTSKKQIVARLEALNTAVATAQEGKLNDEQRLVLLNGLTRFNKALRDYQTTMLIVEQSALASENVDETVSLVETLSDTITTFSEISDNIQSYVEESVPEDFNNDSAIDESSLTPEELNAMASSSAEVEGEANITNDETVSNTFQLNANATSS